MPDQRPTEDARRPTRIGPYRILEALGEGGMGSVYLAEQREPVRRRVAIKLIKLGMDSRQVLARFEAERQALAMMSHDNIARVFEVGATERGQPYFVMEHVEGIPITAYCDRHRLTIAERVELFQLVCSGVQHAHQKGIIHRDLKPGNVLVMRRDERTVPKIIDFGLARATNHQLVEHTYFTEQGQIVGTPEYMSPEQAVFDAQGIDTRTDIYSLGVMLYELLAGELPFPAKELRRAGMVEIQRMIREDQPPKPSTRVSTLADEAGARQRRSDPSAWARQVRGELDWIVLKAMAKEPERRYESATGLSMDLGRFLAREPVLAGPPSAAYRLRKLAQKHRGKFAAAALVLATLLAGIVGTTWFAVSAAEERQSVLRLSDAKRVEEFSAQAQELWPAYPDKIAALSAWLDRARELYAHKQLHEATRAALSAKALAVRAAAASPARVARLRQIRGRLSFLTNALAAREGHPPELPAVDWSQGSTPPMHVLNERAWRSATPARDEFGDEAMALVYAREAAESVEKGTLQEAMAHDTLAWAKYANGRDQEARDEAARVIEFATELDLPRLIEFENSLLRLIDEDSTEAAKARARAEIRELEAAADRLERELAASRVYEFDNVELQWQHDVVSELIASLEVFGDPDPAIGSIASVEQRLRFAESVEQRSLVDGGTAWAEAIASIGDREQCPQYAGLALRAQLGLVPIGRDPHSGLWEFSHLQTGRVATRDAGGELVLPEGAGLVFVLVPGGTFDIRGAGAAMMPMPRVTLDPFFISKFEMTQGQWRRFVGSNPSTFAPGRTFGGVEPYRLHPVESVTWNECHAVLRRLGLTLPTEAQWEYAARGGTSGPWWTRPNAGETQEAAADRGGILATDQIRIDLLDALDMPRLLVETWLGGTLTVHAPVYDPEGRGAAGEAPARANPFGLHDTIGNVWEWCLDHHGPDSVPVAAGTGERKGAGHDLRRVARGGSFINPPARARVSLRYPVAADVSDYCIGVRPSKPIE